MNTRQKFEEAYKESHYSLWWNSSNDLFLTDEDECYYDMDVQESWIKWQAERNQINAIKRRKAVPQNSL